MCYPFRTPCFVVHVLAARSTVPMHGAARIKNRYDGMPSVVRVKTICPNTPHLGGGAEPVPAALGPAEVHVQRGGVCGATGAGGSEAQCCYGQFAKPFC